jgi:Serine/threonine protein phosphatase
VRGKFYGITDIGRVRNKNEDAYIINPFTGLFAIADGLGGRKAGDFASNYALEILDLELQKTLKTERNPKMALLRAFLNTSSAVFQKTTSSLELRRGYDHINRPTSCRIKVVYSPRRRYEGLPFEGGNTFIY